MRYIGRWSQGIAPLFLSWRNLPRDQRGLDVGCGTGALSAAILDRASPKSLVGIEPSEGFLWLADRNLGSRANLFAGSTAKLPLENGARTWDAAVALDPAAAQLHEGHRFPICRPSALQSSEERRAALRAGLQAALPSGAPVTVARLER